MAGKSDITHDQSIVRELKGTDLLSRCISGSHRLQEMREMFTTTMGTQTKLLEGILAAQLR